MEFLSVEINGCQQRSFVTTLKGPGPKPPSTTTTTTDPSDRAPLGTLRSQGPTPFQQYQECGTHKVGTPRKHWGHQSTNCSAAVAVAVAVGVRVFTATMPPDQKPLHTRPSASVLTSWQLFLAAVCLLYSTLVSSARVAFDPPAWRSSGVPNSPAQPHWQPLYLDVNEKHSMKQAGYPGPLAPAMRRKMPTR